MAEVFLNYCSIDLDAAIRLQRAIEAAGHQVWIDQDNLRPGDLIIQRIEEGLTAANYLVLCISPTYPDAYYTTQWLVTLTRQLTGYSVKILPVRLSGGELPTLLAGRRYADLTKDWDSGVSDLCTAIR